MTMDEFAGIPSMTEAQWLFSTDPAEMLRAILSGELRVSPLAPYPSLRKLRLFAEACERQCPCNAAPPGYSPHAWASLPEAVAGCPCTRTWRAALLRCLIGKPFRPVPSLANYHEFTVEWRKREITAIARTIYDERRFGDLPILADALEEAGCPPDEKCPACYGSGRTIWQADTPRPDTPHALCGGTGRLPNPLLAHLRGPGPHARGCWALDLVLGKE